jgi:hypothetical protein
MILFIEGPVDPRDELVVELLIRDGIEDETAVVGILSRIDLGEEGLQLERGGVVGGRRWIFISGQRSATERSRSWTPVLVQGLLEPGSGSDWEKSPFRLAAVGTVA